jgi:subtilisin family serine protease
LPTNFTLTCTSCSFLFYDFTGTAAGATYGVAKRANIIPVKVLNSSGSGSGANVIAGIDWVKQQHQSSSSKRSVANMSLGGGKSSAENEAVNSAVAAGVVFVVAAGNDNANACNYSPASASEALTVGSTTQSDARSGFSNFGSCVDIFAPGSGILSASPSSDTATATLSGTSMASPRT